MAKPWTKKNPALSMFLSGANAWAGAARGLWAGEARRQKSAAAKAGAKAVASFWTAALTPAASAGKKGKRRT